MFTSCRHMLFLDLFIPLVLPVPLHRHCLHSHDPTHCDPRSLFSPSPNQLVIPALRKLESTYTHKQIICKGGGSLFYKNGIIVLFAFDIQQYLEEILLQAKGDSTKSFFLLST